MCSRIRIMGVAAGFKLGSMRVSRSGRGLWNLGANQVVVFPRENLRKPRGKAHLPES